MTLKIKFILFIFFLISSLYAQDLAKSPVINKIVYRKDLIDFNQPVIINIYLNPMKAIDVSIFLNEKEITNLNKNLRPFDNNYDKFYPHINFEISNVKEENTLHIFVTLSEGLVVDAIEKIKFNKTEIIDENSNIVTNVTSFYIKVGEIKEGFFYDITFNKNLLKKIEDVFYNNNIYSRFEVVKKGVSPISIYRFNENDFNLNISDITPIKEFKIIIE
ncbi:MAG TPA: hypothetical protein PLE45_07165 [Spirochaetota bacterium]|nr:hypothetical protein [Spirochaetota bacterium]HOL56958.1 hypothetical protein [Spirochaetota bacterium]HPP04531.1 hypothetical protein [Spirochaetota bacterium]